MVLDHRDNYRFHWAAVVSVSEKTGSASRTLPDWFNNKRLLEPIGTITLAEAEKNYYAMRDQNPMAA